jgi:hypothetical protein
MEANVIFFFARKTDKAYLPDVSHALCNYLIPELEMSLKRCYFKSFRNYREA